MSDKDAQTADKESFPPRDEHGRVADLGQWLGFVAAAVVIGFGLLLALDVIVSLFDWGTFGNTNGWVAAILAAFLFTDDFKNNKFRTARWQAMALALVLGIMVTLAVSLFLPPWPVLFSGGVAALFGALVYAWVWFAGVRALGDDVKENKS